MRVLFVMGGGFDRPSPSLHLERALVSALLDSGNEVCLVCSVLSEGDDGLLEEWKRSESFSSHLIRRKKVTKSNFIQRYLEGVLYSFKLYSTIRSCEKCDVAFVQSSPTVLFNIIATKLAARGLPIVYAVQDVFPGSSVASGVMKGRMLPALFAKLQRVAYSMSRKVIAINEDMKVKLEEQNVPSDKIEVIVNWFDGDSVRRIRWDQNRFVQQQGMEQGAFYVQYAGTVGYVFDYETFLGAARLLSDCPDIRFQLIAAGAMFDQIREKADEMGLTNIDFLPLQPLELVADVYSAASVCFIPLKRGIIGNSVPSKAGLVMACGTPTINAVDESSYYSKEFMVNEVGYSVDSGDYAGAAEYIMRLHDDPDELRRMGDNAVRYCSERYSKEHGTSRYIEVLEESIA
ncbi:MAG: glycosyltransferase family 4 protein [Eggerthellaceae bacterium]|nr:glycosyltransferase family 4 protein [Eggerthellaceae bacterium]